jgi:nicotinamide mononucleotide transporter
VIESLLTPAFMAWGSPVTWLELVAFGLSVAMVLGNQRQWVGAWPLAIASSALYGLLFWRGKLFGEAVLQGLFIGLSAWGWLQWARGAQGHALPVQRLSPKGWLLSLAAVAVLGPLVGFFLARHTSSPLPYWDALPTVLLGRKYLENWAFWVVINAVSVGLFAQRGYWLTMLLYAAFIPLALAGWRLWRRG